MDKKPQKARSKRTRKRKGWNSGKKAWEIAREQHKAAREAARNETGSENPDESRQDSDSENENDGQEDVIESPEIRNVSAEKLLNTSFNLFEDEESHLTRSKTKTLGLAENEEECQAHGYKLQDATLLSECISAAAICSSCRKASSKLQLLQDNTRRNGLAEHLFLKCNLCGHETALNTSSRLGGQGGGAYEINRRSVIAAHHMGLAGLNKFCGRMDLPPPVTSKAYNDQVKQVKVQAVATAEDLMCDAAERLRSKTADESPDKMHVTGEGVSVADVAVTVDGTWQKRGHTSKIGVVFIISVRTGEILDFVVKSVIFPECTAHKIWDKDSNDYLSWKLDHNPACEINHEGSSGAMEAKAAVEMFSESIKKRKLRYTLFVGDGDSSCFGTVKESLKDIYNVEKEECVGHVQKRMGSALRNFKTEHKGKKLADGKPVVGKGRLTERVINSMQNYYGVAIRDNKSNLQGMKDGIWATYHHMIKPDDDIPLEEQHKFCPKDEHTWCKFWFDKLHNKTDKITYDESKRLPSVFRTELKYIFVRLSDDKLLSRCLKGMTQNQNEAVNGQLWLRCPKTRFCGKRRVTLAVCETVCVFNTGEGSTALLMRNCGVQPGINMMRSLRKQDTLRVANAIKKISGKYKKQRRGQRAKAKSKADKNAYDPGSFGVASKPEKANTRKAKRNEAITESEPTVNEGASTSQATQSNVEIEFVAPVLEVVHQPKAKRAKRH